MAGANTKVAIASNALQLIGSSAIASFGDDDAGAVVANNIFDDIAEELLAFYPWSFAKKQSDALSMLTQTPDTLWDRVHQLPSDLLALRRIVVNSKDIDYEVYGDRVFSNAAEADDVYAVYTHYADVTVWPPAFRLFMEYRLATIFATSVAIKADLAGFFLDKAEVQGRIAKSVDAQQDTTQAMTTTRFITVRR